MVADLNTPSLVAWSSSAVLLLVERDATYLLPNAKPLMMVSGGVERR
jgi:hypothetical protein